MSELGEEDEVRIRWSICLRTDVIMESNGVWAFRESEVKLVRRIRPDIK